MAVDGPRKRITKPESKEARILSLVSIIMSRWYEVLR